MSAASIVTCDTVADIVREVFDLVRSQYVFAFGLALLLGQAQADTISTNGITWVYRIVDDHVEIGGGGSAAIPTSVKGEVEIPSRIKNKDVTKIQSCAFHGCSFSSVKIPSTITEIAGSAFCRCSMLTNVTIPASVTLVNRYAFAWCSRLEEVRLLGLSTELESGESTSVFYGASSTFHVQVASGAVGCDTPRKGYWNSYPYKPLAEIDYAVEASNAVIKIGEKWFAKYPDFDRMYGCNYTRAITSHTHKVSVNGDPMSVWHDYVAGTDPTDEESRFTSAIEMSNGVPVVTWSPNLNTNEAVRLYRVWGAATLDGSWAWPADAVRHRFFKVEVAMPDGATATDAPGPVGGGEAGER